MRFEIEEREYILSLDKKRLNSEEVKEFIRIYKKAYGVTICSNCSSSINFYLTNTIKMIKSYEG